MKEPELVEKAIPRHVSDPGTRGRFEDLSELIREALEKKDRRREEMSWSKAVDEPPPAPTVGNQERTMVSFPSMRSSITSITDWMLMR